MTGIQNQILQHLKELRTALGDFCVEVRQLIDDQRAANARIRTLMREKELSGARAADSTPGPGSPPATEQ
jgi:hypothetical protein